MIAEILALLAESTEAAQLHKKLCEASGEPCFNEEIILQRDAALRVAVEALAKIAAHVPAEEAFAAQRALAAVRSLLKGAL